MKLAMREARHDLVPQYPPQARDLHLWSVTDVTKYTNECHQNRIAVSLNARRNCYHIVNSKRIMNV